VNTETAASSWADLLHQLGSLSAYLRLTGQWLVQPWQIGQAIYVAILFAAALMLERLALDPIEAWVRSRQTTASRLKFYALILRRLRYVIFVAGGWVTVYVMREVTWPSRSYLVLVATNLAAVWLFISVSSRLIRNRLWSRAAAIAAFAVAAIYILNLAEPVVNILDSIALQVGTTRFSLLGIGKAAIILASLLWLSSVISTLTERRLSLVEELSPSMRVLVGKLTRVGLFSLAVVFGLQSVGFDLTTLTVFSGAVGLGLGFGLQKVVSNLVSGVILLIDKSVKPGDIISLGETFGWISSLGARYVSVVTRDGKEYIIPNEDLITNRVVNWSYSNELVRLEVHFGVSYDSDPHAVRRLATEAAIKPERVRANPKPVCHLTGFGDSAINFVLRFWIADPSNGVVNIQGEVLLALWDALKANNIRIPYPQRDVHLYPTATPQGGKPTGPEVSTSPTPGGGAGSG
jgi:small-conductance mechanosensitive channel